VAAAVSDPVVRAAGAVLWRVADGSSAVEVALVHRPRYDDWSLPKGKLDAGEHPLVAGCREVVEETGVQPAIGPRLPTVSYQVAGADGPVPKTVDYWAMRAISDGRDFEPNHEVDAIRWLPLAEARELLTYQHDRPVLDAFAGLPPVTGTILLIRHARAGSRKKWSGDDNLRPLDRRGRLQAAQLALALPCFRPTRILAADRLRCVQTVRPLADALGLPIEVEHVFSEHAADPEQTAAHLRDLAAAGGVAAVCSQGGTIPAALARLTEADGLALHGIESKKGSVWVLSFQGSTLVGADYLSDLEP
jgi:8-oxo-dGTP diphosphatase